MTLNGPASLVSDVVLMVSRLGIVGGVNARDLMMNYESGRKIIARRKTICWGAAARYLVITYLLSR